MENPRPASYPDRDFGTEQSTDNTEGGIMLASLHYPASSFLFPWPSNATNRGLLLLYLLSLFLLFTHSSRTCTTSRA